MRFWAVLGGIVLGALFVGLVVIGVVIDRQSRAEVRRLGSEAMKCPVAEVEIEDSDGDDDATDWHVRGCGQTIVLHCLAQIHDCRVQPIPARR